MTQLQEFVYDQTPIRTVIIDGSPWFVSSDVCSVLGISSYRDAVSRLDPDERASVEVDTLGGKQGVSGVNESGLYSLVMTSRKPEAKEFKKWVTAEVLPTIRKTGTYTIRQSDDQLIVVGYEAAIRKIKLLQEKISEDRPKVESAEALTRCDQNMSITEAAKHFGLHPKLQVFPYLRARGYLTSRDLPTQEAIDLGILAVRQNQIPKGNFYSQAVVEKASLEMWRTNIVPRIIAWSNLQIPEVTQ